MCACVLLSIYVVVVVVNGFSECVSQHRYLVLVVVAIWLKTARKQTCEWDLLKYVFCILYDRHSVGKSEKKQGKLQGEG